MAAIGPYVSDRVEFDEPLSGVILDPELGDPAIMQQALDAPQPRIAELLGVSARTFQRWISESDSVAPEGEELRRLRIVSAVANHLRHALTGPGVLAWFERGHPLLRGSRPADLLDEPD